MGTESYWDLFINREWSELKQFYGMLRHLSLDDPWLLPMWIVLGLFACEFVFPMRSGQHKRRPGVALDVFYFFFNWMLLWVVFGTAVLAVTRTFFDGVMWEVFGREREPLISLAGMQLWARYALMLVVIDLLAWAGHWTLHRFDFLWRFHKVHHSALVLDVWNASRLHWIEKLYYPIFYMIPMAIIGWPTGDVLGVVFFGSLLGNVLSCYTHTNLRIPIGPLKYLFNSPQMHIWHHALEIDTRRNVNYGDALSCWDWMFGTAYMPEHRGEIPLGFEGVEAYPTTFWGQFVAPFRNLAPRRPGGAA